MDEKYIQSLHSQLGGESVFGKYEDFKDLIASDPEYAKNFYNNFGQDVLGGEQDFYSLVKKKDIGASTSGATLLALSPKNPSTYNKNIESRDWQRHQELTRTIQDAAQKNDAIGIKNAQSQLEQLRASNPSIASDPLLNEDLQTANKFIKAAPVQPEAKPIAEVALGIKEKAPIPTRQRAQEEASVTEINKKLNVLGDFTPEELNTSFKLTMLESGLAKETAGFKEESNQYSEDEFSKIENPDRLISAINNRLQFNLPSTSSRPIDDAITQSILYFKKNKQQATNEEIIARAKDILSEKKLQGSIDKEIDNILTSETPFTTDLANTLINLVDPGKEIITDPLLSGNQSNMLKDIESMKNKVVLEKARFDKNMENWNSLKSDIEDISQEEFNAMPEEDKNAFIAKQQELNLLSKDLYSKFDAWNNSDDNIQDFSQETDLLKRNYGVLSNAVGKAQAGALSILGGGARAIGFEGKGIESADKLKSTLSKPMSYKDVETPYDFFRYAGSQIVDQAANFALAYTTGGMAPYIIGTSAAGQKYKGLEKEETQAGKELYSTGQKLLTSALVGGLEILTEKAEIDVWKKALPSWRLAEAAKKGATNLELNVMRDEFKKGIKSVITFGKEVGSNQFKEGSAEAFSQIGGNLADKYVLGKKNVGIFDGVDDAFVGGATIGGLITIAPALAAQAIAPFVNDPGKKIKSNADKLKQLETALADAQDINKPTIQAAIDKLSKENVSLINGGIKIMDGLTPSEIRRNVELYDRIKDVKKQYLDIKNDASLSEEQKKSAIGVLNEEYNNAVTERLSLLKKGEANAIQEQGSGQVPVQPETGVSQEVEQGKLQAKPQGVTEEVKAKEVVIDKPTITINSKPEVDPVKNAASDVETGQTFNIDGTVYTGGGLVVPVATQNLTQEELTPELIADFVEQNKSKVGSNAVKVGIYKFPNSNKVSIDLNIVVPRENRKAALEFGRLSGQESLFDLDTFENVKTGADGNNPIKFNDDQFVDIAKNLEIGVVPDVFAKSEFDQALNKSAEALNVVAPGLKVIVGKNIEDVQSQIIEAITPLIGERQARQTAKEFATGTKGQTIFVDGKPFAVVFDKTTANSRTAGHEAWEVMLNDAFGNDQAKFKKFTEGIDAQLRAQGFEDIADALDAFASQKGYENVKYSEYMAELGGMLVDSGFGKGPLTAQQKTLLQKIGDIINKFAELFTGKKQFLDQATPEDILGFMMTISNKVAKGEDVSSFFRKGDKAKTKEGVTSRKQAEKIFTGKEKVPTFKSLPEIANWLESWSKKNKIFAKDIKDVSDEEFVKKLEDHTLKELASWDSVRGQDYVSFYVGDIIDRLNPKLQKFAEARYGRMLTPAEVTLYHTVSGFASPQADPMFDSSKGLEIFDKYMNGGNPDISKLSGYADKQATIYALNDKGKKVDTGKLKFDKEGNPVYSQVSMHYAVTSLNKTKALISHFKGDVTKAMEWMTSIHSYEDISDVMGTPLKGQKALTPHENLSKENGGFGIFGFTGAKLGSYILNRVGEYSTVTKDMWYARTMARLVGEPLTKDGKAMTDPWASNTVAGAKKRKLADQAWESVAKKLNITPSDVQERMWDFEKRLYEKMGALEKASYASEGFMKTAKKLEPGLDLDTKVVESRSQKNVPQAVDEVLTDDGKGNYLFVHYSDEKRDVIRPMSGSNKNFTSREEVSAIASVGGLAMYYTKAGQKENGVGDVAHTVLVPKDKVYFYGTTDKGTVSHDPQGFEEEARRRFQEYKNRGNEKNPTKYAFDGNNAAAWVTKVAGENGYDMVLTNWGTAKSYRAQTTKKLTPEDDYTGFKKIEDDVFEIGDEIFLRGSYAKVTDVNGSIVRYEGTNQYGGAVSGVFDINRSNAIMIEKAKPVVTTRAQRVDVKVIPGYDRMMNNVEGIMDKTINARNGSYNKATANAIDYIQKSLAYINADDIQRNQIIRDFNEMRGEKLKKAPSVNKILGKIKDITKVTVNEAVALKDQIKLEVKAAKGAVKYVNELRNSIMNELKDIHKKGKISTKQLTSLLKAASRLNVQNSLAVSRFVDRMIKVFNNAEYAEKILEARKISKRISTSIKNKDVQPSNRNMAKNFLLVNPKDVDNIDEYLDKAKEVLMSVAANAGLKTPADIAAVNKYSATQIEQQNQKRMDEIKEKYQELFNAGILSDNMTEKEMLEAINNIDISENEEQQDEEVVKTLAEIFDDIKDVASEILESGEDPITGEKVVLTEAQKSIIKKFIGLDLNTLSNKEAKLAVERLDNFINNYITEGMEGLANKSIGAEAAKELEEKGIQARPLRLYFSKWFATTMANQIWNLHKLIETMFVGQSKDRAISSVSGIYGVEKGVNIANTISNEAIDEYVAKFGKEEEFFALDNNYERGIAALLFRDNGDEDYFEDQKSLIQQSIDVMLNSKDDNKIKKGEVAQKVFDKLIKDAKNGQEVMDNASETNRNAILWWINNWGVHYSDFEETSKNVYNDDLGRDANFTSKTYKKADPSKEKDADLSGNASAYRMTTGEYTVKSKSGSLIKTKKVKTLPKNRVLSFDFDINQANAFRAALVDIKTAAEIRKLEGFINSPSFMKLGPEEDMQLLRARINTWIATERGKSFASKSDFDKAIKLLKASSAIGTTRALLSIAQPIAQTVPVAISTLINSGGRLMLLNNSMKQFINSSGMAIANRGAESSMSLSSENKIIEEASKNKGLRAISAISKIPKKGLTYALAKPDIGIAKMSFIAYYAQKVGKRVYQINWTEEANNPNEAALRYAQQMVDRQQNVSNANQMGNMFTSKEPLNQALRMVAFPLATFSMNQKARMQSDIITLAARKESTSEDKKAAALSLAGLVSEMSTYLAIRAAIGYGLYSLSLSLMGLGDDDKEEEKKKKFQRIMTNSTGTIATDLFSPLPMSNNSMLDIANFAIDKYYGYKNEGKEELTDKQKKRREEDIKWYKDNGIDVPEEYKKLIAEKPMQFYTPDNIDETAFMGTGGIAISKIIQSSEFEKMALTGKFEKESYGKKTTKYLLPEDQKVLKQWSSIPALYNLGFMPAELNAIANNLMQIAQKRAITEKQKEKQEAKAKWYKDNGVTPPKD